MAFDPNAYISPEFVNPRAIDEVIQSLKETRALGRVGGCSADDFSPVTGRAWLIDMAEHYDCEVSGPYDRDTDDGGDYFLFHHRPKPPIPQGDLFEWAISTATPGTSRRSGSCSRSSTTRA